MKRIISLSLIMCSLLLTACNDASIGVIGGADGPTEICVGKNNGTVKGQFGEQLEKKVVRMFNVDGELYYDSGLVSENTPRCGTTDGVLKRRLQKLKFLFNPERQILMLTAISTLQALPKRSILTVNG